MSCEVDEDEVRCRAFGATMVATLVRDTLRPRTADQLVAALDLANNDRTIRAFVLTGRGKRFCLGAELTSPSSLAESISRDAQESTGDAYQEPAGRVTLRMRRMRVPVIAALNGDAIGGGATIAAGADVRVCAEHARFGFVFTRRGVTPEGVSTWLLPRLVGSGVAADWLLSGRVIDAAEALRAGFVSAAVPADRLWPYALEYTELFEHTSARAVAVTRQLLADSSCLSDPTEAGRLESAALAELADSADAREGIGSFLQHRPAEFTSTGREPPPDTQAGARPQRSGRSPVLRSPPMSRVWE